MGDEDRDIEALEFVTAGLTKMLHNTDLVDSVPIGATMLRLGIRAETIDIEGIDSVLRDLVLATGESNG